MIETVKNEANIFVGEAVSEQGQPAATEHRKISPLVIKNGILLGLLALSLAVLLFSPMMTMHYRNINLYLKISGLSLLIGLFTGMEKTFTGTIMGKVTIEIPAIPTALLLVGIALVAGLIAFVCVMTFRLKKESRAVGFSMLGVGLYFIVTYCVLILSDSIVVTGIDHPELLTDWPLQSPFYKRFELGVSLLITIVALVFAGYFQLITKLSRMERIVKYKVMYALLIVPTLCVFLFSLYPIFLQTVMSFKDYSLGNISSGIWGSNWIGMGNFITIFTDPAMLRVIGNTLLISACRIVVQLIPPIVLSIMLFDMGHDKVRKTIQTILYIPHFFSWVIIYAIAYAFINVEGIINVVITTLGGEAKIFFNNDSTFIPILLITDLWKELGWGTILYLASLSGIDPGQYEAAALDGAGPMQKLFYITLPNMKPIIMFMAIMSVGNLLKGAGGEQILLFGNDHMEMAQVIDTWVIWYGLGGEGLYSVSAAMSFFQAFIGIIMVLTCNHFSKKLAGVGMW